MIQNIRRSLTDLLGAEYTAAVCRARAALTGESPEALRAVADEKVDFYPEAFARRQEELMGDIGHSLAPAFADTEDGAPTHSYRAAQHSFAAPLGGLGAFRIGEDGRLYFAGKSEHYQIPLGHDFPGYSLIENAKRLGIPNATHTTPAALSPARWSAASSPPPTASNPQTRRWTAFCPKRSRAC